MAKTWTELGHHKTIIIRNETLEKLRNLQANIYVREGRRPSYAELLDRLMKKSGMEI